MPGGKATQSTPTSRSAEPSQHVGPARERVVVDVTGDLHGDEASEGGEHPADGQDGEGGDEGGLLGLGPEELALDDQQGEHAGADEQGDDVGGVHEVQCK